MDNMKHSFLSDIIGDFYAFKGIALFIFVIGTCAISVVLLLSLCFHWWFISDLLYLTTGTSIFFIIYIIAGVLALDVEVEGENKPMTTYGLTIIWCIVLVVLGICAIYFSNKYRKQYAFECRTFVVDNDRGIYHLDWDNDCEVAAEACNLVKLKGYQIDKSYRLCEWCEEWADEAEEEYESIRYSR